jgi:hypothetical protein
MNLVEFLTKVLQTLSTAKTSDSALKKMLSLIAGIIIYTILVGQKYEHQRDKSNQQDKSNEMTFRIPERNDNTSGFYLNPPEGEK